MRWFWQKKSIAIGNFTGVIQDEPNPSNQKFESTREIALSSEEWLKLMLPRIAKYSAVHSGEISVPQKVYHGSPVTNIKQFDTTLGQGIGAWFQESIKQAADFSLARSRFLKIANPTVYEVEITPNNPAVFPDEIDMHMIQIRQEKDPLMFKPDLSLSEIAKVLIKEGYDSIYLQEQKTYSMLQGNKIKILAVHDALSLADPHKKQAFEQRPGLQVKQKTNISNEQKANRNP